MGKEQKAQDQLWQRLVPAFLQRVISVFVGAEEEIMAAYTSTANNLLWKRLNRASKAAKRPVLKANVGLIWDPFNLPRAPPAPESMEVAVFERVVDPLRAKIQS